MQAEKCMPQHTPSLDEEYDSRIIHSHKLSTRNICRKPLLELFCSHTNRQTDMCDQWHILVGGFRPALLSLMSLKVRGNGKGTYTWYSVSSWIITSEALRYGTCSQWISQFYLHAHTFIRNRNEKYLPLFIMRPSSLGGGRILRRTLSVRLSVRPSRYRCHR